MAHGDKLSAHLGFKKSLARLARDFYWSGMQGDVKTACQCCGAGQRRGKNNKKKAPLQPLPAIGEPFRRVAVDIVGPLRRTTQATATYFASQFPEAIPLRCIDAETVADALCTVFTKFGIP